MLVDVWVFLWTSDLDHKNSVQAELLGAIALIEACYNYIDANTVKMLSSPEFLEQPRKVVEAILRRDTLAADGMPEKCIFKALIG